MRGAVHPIDLTVIDLSTSTPFGRAASSCLAWPGAAPTSIGYMSCCWRWMPGFSMPDGLKLEFVHWP
jgi:hypothetical protein